MKRPKAIAAAAALAAAVSLAGASSAGEPARTLILQAMAAPASLSYTGTVRVVRVGRHGTELSVYRVEHRAPDLTRRVYVTPADLSGDAVIVKGNSSFSIDVKRRRIVETTNDALDDRIALQGNYALLRANYHVAIKTGADFDGRPVFDVALVSNYTHRAVMAVRIDRQTKLVLDKRRFAADGSLIGEIRFENVRYVASVPAGDFTLPKQYAVVAGPRLGEPSDDPAGVVRNAGFGAHSPKFLPDGFSPVEGTMIAIKGVRTIHLLYSDGVRTISLFENARATALDMSRLHPRSTRIGDRNAQYAQEGPTELLAWSDGRLYYALVGELNLSELQRIAASLGP